jgi:hypothetical protein
MKTTDRSFKSVLSFGAAALLAVGAATAQVASESAFPGAAMIDSSGSFQQELQACNTGATQQSRADCLKQARNAAAEKNRGRLESYGAHEQHAMQRCEIHMTAEDKASCQARVMGMGSVEGSVAGGGLLREVETVVLPDSGSVTIVPQTSDPVVLVPSTNTMGNR